jgi:hypothetical protein
MSKGKKGWMIFTVLGLVLLMANPAFAKSISIRDAGIALWIFIVVGAVIVLLQLIPAAILFFSFVGTTSALVFKGKKKVEEAIDVTHGLEAAPVKK